MKSFCIVALALVMAVSAADTYSTEHDDLDFKAITEDKTKLKAYVDCFSDVGPCDDITSAFKKDMPEAISQSCAKCNDVQKNHIKLFLKALKELLPEENAVLRKKFDPENKHFPALETAVGA